MPSIRLRLSLEQLTKVGIAGIVMCKQSEGFVGGWTYNGNRQLGTACTASNAPPLCVRAQHSVLDSPFSPRVGLYVYCSVLRNPRNES